MIGLLRFSLPRLFPRIAAARKRIRTNLRRKLAHAAKSDTGRVRPHNEDRVGANGDLGLLVLADGMGGPAAGEVASEIAVRTVLDVVRRSCMIEQRERVDYLTGLMAQTIALRDGILRANKVIYNTANTQPHCAGMGTTIVACLFWDNRVSIAHIGDSRVYRLRNGRLEQLTEDHSLQREMRRNGVDDESMLEAAGPHCITRALGIHPIVTVELREETVRPGDYYLLCSDGLTDMVADQELLHTLQAFGGDLEGASRELIRLGNRHGGMDNLSVVLARVRSPFPADASLHARLQRLLQALFSRTPQSSPAG